MSSWTQISSYSVTIYFDTLHSEKLRNLYRNYELGIDYQQLLISQKEKQSFIMCLQIEEYNTTYRIFLSKK